VKNISKYQYIDIFWVVVNLSIDGRGHSNTSVASPLSEMTSFENLHFNV